MENVVYASDRVEVIRCGDCKFWIHGNCIYLGGQWTPDSYCSEAVRRP